MSKPKWYLVTIKHAWTDAEEPIQVESKSIDDAKRLASGLIGGDWSVHKVEPFDELLTEEDISRIVEDDHSRMHFFDGVACALLGIGLPVTNVENSFGWDYGKKLKDRFSDYLKDGE